MSYIPKQLAQSNVASTTETTVYTVPTGSSCIVKQVVVANVTGSAATISVSVVASGGTAGVTNRILEQVSIPANSTVSFDLSQVMASGGFISVKQGTSSAITTTISGVEFGSTALVKDYALATRSSGDITLNGTSWANVDTGLDLTLSAAAGDLIEVSLSALCQSSTTTETFFDAVSVVSGSPVKAWGVDAAESGSTECVQAWRVRNVTAHQGKGGSVYRVVSADELSSGQLTLRLRYRQSVAENKTLYNSANRLIKFAAVNHGVSAVDVPTGYWQDYTPTLTQSGAVTKTVTYARYTQLGKTVHVTVSLSITGTGTASNQILVGLPVAAHASLATAGIIGSGRVFDSSASLVYRAVVNPTSTTTVRLEPTHVTAGGGLGLTGMTAALASGDIVEFSATYEAA